MANNLKRTIEVGEEVVVSANVLKAGVDPIFVCEGGFGMESFTRGNAIVGYWKADDTKGRIEGYWIDKEATEKHQKELSNEQTTQTK